MKARWMMVAVMGMALAAFGADAAPGPKEVSSADLQMGRAKIIGNLAKPLGTYVTIEGVRPDEAFKSANPLAVDTVDGKKLETPVLLEINGTAELPKGVRCVLRGYETGAMESSPEDPLVKADTQPQQNYHFAVWFVVSQIKEPAALEKR